MEKDIKKKRKIIIAGPCSAESPEQLLAVANELKESGSVDYYRAGIWKPRTSPEAFQGVGPEGLVWLDEVRKITGMKIATEVGCVKHVEEAMKVSPDLLWIGARTVSNPFVIQEIAESLRGVTIPILVKNPLNPDLELWYGAINRFLKLGIDAGAIHRGFSVYGKSVYRNQPIWSIPAELRKRLPGITIIGDPSHIAGKRALVPIVSRKSLEEGSDGLMIEVHNNPDVALSDSAQQLVPCAFNELLEDLNIHINKYPCNRSGNTDDLKTEIELIDKMLIDAISNRMEILGQMQKTTNRSAGKSYNGGKLDKLLNSVLACSETGK